MNENIYALITAAAAIMVITAVVVMVSDQVELERELAICYEIVQELEE